MAVKVESILKDLEIQVLVQGDSAAEIAVSDINRPGLQLAGFYNYFAKERVQIIGNVEWSYLDAMNPGVRAKRIKKYYEFDTPCTIMTRGLVPHEELINNAKINNKWLLSTKSISTRFINNLMNYLDDKLAPETRLHGVLVDVYGIGILIIGDSGIGKSETALELIKRGHRLVADDAVDVKAVAGTLRGSSPYITSGMIEVRGMGIIDVPSLYGLSSVFQSKNIDLIISLEYWNENETYERLGIDDEFLNILDIPVKKLTIPIRPGRNLAVIVEAAAANYRYKLTSKISPADIIDRRMDEMMKNE